MHRIGPRLYPGGDNLTKCFGIILRVYLVAKIATNNFLNCSQVLAFYTQI